MSIEHIYIDYVVVREGVVVMIHRWGSRHMTPAAAISPETISPLSTDVHHWFTRLGSTASLPVTPSRNAWQLFQVSKWYWWCKRGHLLLFFRCPNWTKLPMDKLLSISEEEQKLIVGLSEVDERLECSNFCKRTDHSSPETCRNCSWYSCMDESRNAKNNKRIYFAALNHPADGDAVETIQCDSKAFPHPYGSGTVIITKNIDWTKKEVSIETSNLFNSKFRLRDRSTVLKGASIVTSFFCKVKHQVCKSPDTTWNALWTWISQVDACAGPRSVRKAFCLPGWKKSIMSTHLPPSWTVNCQFIIIKSLGTFLRFVSSPRRGTWLGMVRNPGVGILFGTLFTDQHLPLIRLAEWRDSPWLLSVVVMIKARMVNV